MKVRVVKMRKAGVPIPRRLLGEELATQGQLVILDVTDQVLRRQVKVGRLYQDSLPRYELVEPHIVWASEGRECSKHSEPLYPNRSCCYCNLANH